MTNAEAIETLRANYPDACYEQLREAVDKAIKALEAQEQLANNSPELDKENGELIRKKAAIDAMSESLKRVFPEHRQIAEKCLNALPSAQPTLYGYNMEHLALIAEVLRKENLPPERVVEALTDIGRIASIIRAEFEEELKKAVER